MTILAHPALIVFGGLPGTAGYAIANAIAAENLKLRRLVIADCVNPVHLSRAAWRQTASQNSAPIVEIEVVCSDPALHRQRVEGRSADISGHKLPSWDDVVNRHYEPWYREHLVLDTAETRSITSSRRCWWCCSVGQRGRHERHHRVWPFGRIVSVRVRRAQS